MDPWKPPLRHLVAVGAVLAGVFAAVLNARLVGFALADVQGNLGATRDETIWINTAYAVGEVIVIPFAIWFASVGTIRRVLVPAAFFFALSCVAVLWVTRVEELVALRFVQGLTGGALIPMATPTFRRNLPLGPRVTAFALYGMAATLPFALAPALDAALTDALTWRAVFFVPAVLALLAAAGGTWGMPHQPFHWERAKEVDVVGLSSVGLGLACLVLGADQAFRLDWFEARWVTGFFVAGALLLGLAWRHTRHHPSAAYTHDVLTQRNLMVALATYGVVRLSLMVVGAVIPDFLVRAQKLRPLDFGALFLVMVVPQVVLPLVVARWARRLEPRLVFAASIALQGMAMLRAAALTGDWKTEELAPVLLLHGAGQGLLFVPLLLLLTQNLDDAHRPTAMTLTNLTRAGGNALGVALMGTFLGHSQRFHDQVLRERMHGVVKTVGREAWVLAFGDLLTVLGVVLVLVVVLQTTLRPVDLNELIPRDAASPTPPAPPQSPPGLPTESSLAGTG